MSKSKSAARKAEPRKAEAPKSAKAGRVTKQAQTAPAKAKELAKSASGKHSKAPKKEDMTDSEAESDVTSESSESSEEESEDEKVPAPKANGGKVNGTNGLSKPVDSDESDDSDDSASDEDVPAPKMNGQAKAAAEADSDSDSEESDEEVPAKANGVKANGVKTNGVSKAVKGESDSESDSDDSASEAEVASKPAAAAASDDSDDSESDDEDVKGAVKEEESDDSDESSDDEVEQEAPSKKRKAEDSTPAASKKAKTQGSGAVTSGNVFVGSLSWNVDEDWLQREFEEFGDIVSVRVITDRDSGRSKGFGYVEFKNAADAEKAIEAKHGSEIDNRQINVNSAEARPANKPNDSKARAQRFGDSVSAPSDTLFIGNLSFDANEEMVADGVSGHGNIQSIRLPTDRESGQLKGYGYITFSSVDEAKATFDAHNGNLSIAGRSVRLDFAQPRDPNGGGDRGGDRGGRGRGGFGGRGGGRGGGFGGGRGRGGFGDRGRGGSRGGRGGTTNRGGFGDFKGKKQTF
ncbi:hypothetical protein K402DRAFT_404566 [Aulographum hederae CBS 113979]|uniref:RRM domain-containing protein n=1 Tax=Aulographum hederae CBS 113979 TaxID=1176131 RepID=A0A6G1GZ84_9PEZI|nr:hypothetical protein K402DRAFT_404566 [Aulographum hederae CBS 113979]